MEIATAWSTPAVSLPWYRVIPPFRWVTQPRKPQRLRPAGHSAWVEAMHQPVLFLISLAFTAAGLYTLAKDYVVRAFAAIGAGDYGQIIPVALALFVILITGAAIEIAFLTAASRLRMHLLRHEWGWMLVSAAMLLLTVGADGLTCSYMFYLIEAPHLSSSWQLFMANIPTALFFVRAFAGLVCAAYLIIGVLPFVIRPDDVRREMAAEAGAAKVEIIQRLLHVINDLSVWQMLAIYEPVAAIFRDNAGYTGSQMAHRLVLDALSQVKAQLSQAIAARAGSLGVDADQLTSLLTESFAPLEQAFHQRGTGAELERYDEQTHAALTRLQERLQRATSAQTSSPEHGIPAEQFAHLVAQLAELREHVASMPAMTHDDQPAIETRLQAWAEQLAHQFGEQIAVVQARITAFETGDEATMSTSAAPPDTTNPVQPKPGTKKFNLLVYDTALKLLPANRLSIYNLAQELNVDPTTIQAVLTALKEARVKRLRPGTELESDPILDIL